MKISERIKELEEGFSKSIIKGMAYLTPKIYTQHDYMIEKDALIKLIEIIDDMSLDDITIENEDIKIALMDIVSKRIRIIHERNDLFNNGQSIQHVRNWIKTEIIQTFLPDSEKDPVLSKLDRAFEMLLIQTCITWFNRDTQKKLQMLLESNRQLSIEKSSSSNILENIKVPIMIFKNDSLDYINLEGVRFVNKLRYLDEAVNFGNLISKLSLNKYLKDINEASDGIFYALPLAHNEITISAMNHYSLSGKYDGIIVTICNNPAEI